MNVYAFIEMGSIKIYEIFNGKEVVLVAVFSRRNEYFIVFHFLNYISKNVRTLI